MPFRRSAHACYNSYIQFVKEHYARIKKRNIGRSLPFIGNIMGKIYRKISNTEQICLKKRAQEAYRIASNFSKKKQVLFGRPLRQKLRRLRSALSVFMLFSNDVQEHIRSTHSALPAASMAKKIGSMYRNLSYQEKMAYHKKSLDLRKKLSDTSHP